MLIGMLAAFNQFISKFANHFRPFYQLLKKWKGFRWNGECERAFSGFEGVFDAGTNVNSPGA